MQVLSLGWEDPLEEKWQPMPLFLPGESCGEEPGDLQSTVLQSRTQLKPLSLHACNILIQKESKENSETQAVVVAVGVRVYSGTLDASEVQLEFQLQLANSKGREQCYLYPCINMETGLQTK